MAVLVTGGAGYIGSHMVLALIEAGERVIVVDDLSTGRREAVPDGVRLEVADVGDSAAMGQLMVEEGIESVLHFAGSIVVPDSIADPLGYYLNNTVKSRALIDTAVKSGVRHFVFSSTAAVYGIPESNPIPEDAALQPISPYGSSKLMTEIMLRDTAAAHGLNCAVLRYFNVAGADPDLRSGQSTPRATHLIKVACQAAVGLRPEIEIYGDDYATPDGTCIRDYIHVSDLANAHLLALDHLRGAGGSLLVNCGYGKGHSVREVIETVRRASGIDIATRVTARRPGDPDVLVAGAQRIRDELGWRPVHDDLDAIVAHALAWEKRLAAEVAGNVQ